MRWIIGLVLLFGGPVFAFSIFCWSTIDRARLPSLLSLSNVGSYSCSLQLLAFTYSVVHAVLLFILPRRLHQKSSLLAVTSILQQTTLRVALDIVLHESLHHLTLKVPTNVHQSLIGKVQFDIIWVLFELVVWLACKLEIKLLFEGQKLSDAQLALVVFLHKFDHLLTNVISQAQRTPPFVYSRRETRIFSKFLRWPRSFICSPVKTSSDLWTKWVAEWPLLA